MPSLHSSRHFDDIPLETSIGNFEVSGILYAGEDNSGYSPDTAQETFGASVEFKCIIDTDEDVEVAHMDAEWEDVTQFLEPLLIAQLDRAVMNDYNEPDDHNPMDYYW